MTIRDQRQGEIIDLVDVHRPRYKRKTLTFDDTTWTVGLESLEQEETSFFIDHIDFWASDTAFRSVKTRITDTDSNVHFLFQAWGFSGQHCEVPYFYFTGHYRKRHERILRPGDKIEFQAGEAKSSSDPTIRIDYRVYYGVDFREY